MTTHKIHAAGWYFDDDGVRTPYLRVRHEDGEMTISIPMTPEWLAIHGAQVLGTVELPDDMPDQPTAGVAFRLTW
jgi:hypothetical protein